MTRNRIYLHGGIDTRELLVYGIPEDIRREIQVLKQELGRKRRYILGGSHLLQVDVPLVNIEAIIKEIR